MATIKEKAEEYSFIEQGIGPSGIQYRDFSINKKDAFIAGASYVLDIIEQCLTPQKCFTEHDIDICAEALVKTALQTIEQLKK